MSMINSFSGQCPNCDFHYQHRSNDRTCGGCEYKPRTVIEEVFLIKIEPK